MILQGIIHLLTIFIKHQVVISFAIFISYIKHRAHSAGDTANGAIAVWLTLPGFHHAEVTFRIKYLPGKLHCSEFLNVRPYRSSSCPDVQERFIILIDL